MNHHTRRCRTHVPRGIAIGLYLFTVGYGSGCGSPEAKPVRIPSPSRSAETGAGTGQPARRAGSPDGGAFVARNAERYRALAALEFEAGLFLKPAPDEPLSLTLGLAPLIVQETTSVGELRRFGTVAVDDDGLFKVAPKPATIYAHTAAILIDGYEHEQITFLWWYPLRARRPADRALLPRESSCQARGIRITLGTDGFPAIHELLVPGERTSVVFVSRSLEAAAAKRFGRPLPGRRFSVEVAADVAPHVVVAASIADGPIPMGPYVYVAAKADRPTTILCRCMPSQVGRIDETAEYELADLATLAQRSGATPEALVRSLLLTECDVAANHNGVRFRARSLTEILRLPAGF